MKSSSSAADSEGKKKYRTKTETNQKIFKQQEKHASTSFKKKAKKIKRKKNSESH